MLVIEMNLALLLFREFYRLIRFRIINREGLFFHC